MVTVKDIASLLEIPVSEQAELTIEAVIPLNGMTDKNAISFCKKEGEAAEQAVKQSQAKLILCKEMIETDDKIVLPVANPRLAFMRVVKTFFDNTATPSIHPGAVIYPNATIGKNVSIGAGTVIYDNVTISDDVLIGANCSIGQDGYGYERNEKGELEKFPHVGGIEIYEGAEIGANVCIDRGTLGNTVIKARARIDNLVHVAHNVVVGEDAAVIALAMLGGSVSVGDRAWIAPSAVIRNQVRIGNDAIVGLGAVVTKDVADKETVMGNPARELESAKRLSAFLKENAG